MNKYFLLLLVIVYLLYNCKPLIEPFDEYDTSQDGTIDYNEEGPQGVEEDYFSYVYGLVAGEEDYSTSESSTAADNLAKNCLTYTSVDNCGSLAERRGHWNYGSQEENTPWTGTDYAENADLKKMCETCFKCKDGNRFVDSYYGWYCDALKSGCGGDATNPDLYPFHYSHHSVDWDNQCGPPGITMGSKNLTAQQTLTCKALNNPVINNFKIFTKPQSAYCATEITAKEAVQMSEEAWDSATDWLERDLQN